MDIFTIKALKPYTDIFNLEKILPYTIDCIKTGKINEPPSYK